MTTRHEIRVVSQRRSGTHAVTAWLAHHFPPPVYLLNDVRAHTDPYQTWVLSPAFSKYLQSGGHSNHFAIPDDQIEAARRRDKHAALVVYEDIDLAPLATSELIPRHDEVMGKADKISTVLSLRDPFNLLASWMKAVGEDGRFRTTSDEVCNNPSGGGLLTPLEKLDQWETYAAEFVGVTRMLGDATKISYNRWFTDETYRRALSSELGLEHSDTGRNVVLGAGGGSSFEGTAMDGRASEMKVLDRWQQFVDVPKYRQLFQTRSGRFFELVEQIFGDVGGARKALGR